MVINMGILVIETFFDKKVVIMVIKIVFVDLAKSARYFVVGRYRNEVTFTQGTSEQSSAGRLAKMWTRIVSIEPTCASRVLHDHGNHHIMVLNCIVVFRPRKWLFW